MGTALRVGLLNRFRAICHAKRSASQISGQGVLIKVWIDVSFIGHGGATFKAGRRSVGSDIDVLCFSGMVCSGFAVCLHQGVRSVREPLADFIAGKISLLQKCDHCEQWSV